MELELDFDTDMLMRDGQPVSVLPQGWQFGRDDAVALAANRRDREHP